MTRCYFCETSDAKVPNCKITIKGKKNGNRVQKKQFVFAIVAAHGKRMKKLKKKY